MARGLCSGTACEVGRLDLIVLPAAPRGHEPRPLSLRWRGSHGQAERPQSSDENCSALLGAALLLHGCTTEAVPPEEGDEAWELSISDAEGEIYSGMFQGMWEVRITTAGRIWLALLLLCRVCIDRVGTGTTPSTT